MASKKTVTLAVQHILTAYPKERAKLGKEDIRGMLDIWPQYLDDLDDTLLLAAVQEHITHSQWLPSIAEIRSAAVGIMRQASPAHQSAIDAWGDVKKAINQIGYYEVPTFSNPITAKVVKRMGWKVICTDDGPDGVLRAQFERYYNGEIARAEQLAAQSPAVTAFVASMGADTFIDAPQQRVQAIAASVAARLAMPEIDMRASDEELEY